MSGDTTHLIVATLMPRGDDSGVARHTETVLDMAPVWGCDTAASADPWRSGRALRGLYRLASALVATLCRITRRRPNGRADTTRRSGLEASLGLALLRSLVACRGRRVVVAQDPTSAVVAARLRGIIRIDRLVLVAHFNDSEWREHIDRGSGVPGDAMERLFRRRERRAVSSVDLVVVPSESSAAHLRDRHQELRGPRLRVAPHAVPLPSPTLRSALPAPPSDLITIGTLEPRKGHRYLLDVLLRCHDLGHPLTLTIVGDGELRSELESHAHDAGLGDAVRFVGRIVPGAGLLPHHRVYVHGAATESFGLAIAEAMGFGLPVCAGPVGAIPELIEDGLQGLLWPLDDAERAAQRLVALITDDVALESMSGAARRTYADRYAPASAVERWRVALLGGR